MEELLHKIETVDTKLRKLGGNLSKELKDKKMYNALFEKIEENLNILKQLKKDFSNFKLKIPFIGHFSSGKSTLINSILGVEGLLETDIKPETDKPYEIFFSEEEIEETVFIRKLEVVRIGYPFDSLEEYKELVLVDLPGISAEEVLQEDQEKLERIVKNHTLITKEYLVNAQFFIVVVDAARGSLGKEVVDLLRLKENTPFCVLFNKEDLLPATKRSRVKEHILKELYPLKPCLIEYTSIDNAEALRDSLTIARKLFPQIKVALFKDRFFESVKEIRDKIESIVYSIDADIEQYEGLLNEMELTLRDAENRLKQLISKKRGAVNKLIRNTERNVRNFLFSERRIDHWAKNVDRYEEEVRDYMEKQISILLEKIEDIFRDMEMEIEESVETLQETLEDLVSRTEKVVIQSKILKTVARAIDIARLIKKLQEVLIVLKTLKFITRIGSIFKNNFVSFGIALVADRLIKKVIRKKIRESNEEIFKSFRKSLSELSAEVKENFEEVEDSVLFMENLEEKKKELNAVRNSRDKILKFRKEFIEIQQTLDQIIASIENIQVGELKC